MRVQGCVWCNMVRLPNLGALCLSTGMEAAGPAAGGIPKEEFKVRVFKMAEAPAFRKQEVEHLIRDHVAVEDTCTGQDEALLNSAKNGMEEKHGWLVCAWCTEHCRRVQTIDMVGVMVVSANGQPRGWGSPHATKRHATINALGVHTDFRRVGVAQALWDHLKDEIAKDAEVNTIDLHVHVAGGPCLNNAITSKLYTRWGFVVPLIREREASIQGWSATFERGKLVRADKAAASSDAPRHQGPNGRPETPWLPLGYEVTGGGTTVPPKGGGGGQPKKQKKTDLQKDAEEKLAAEEMAEVEAMKLEIAAKKAMKAKESRKQHTSATDNEPQADAVEPLQGPWLMEGYPSGVSKLYVRNTHLRDKNGEQTIEAGVFCHEDIEAGSFVCAFAGRFMPVEDFNKKTTKPGYRVLRRHAVQLEFNEIAGKQEQSQVLYAVPSTTDRSKMNADVAENYLTADFPKLHVAQCLNEPPAGSQANVEFFTWTWSAEPGRSDEHYAAVLVYATEKIPAYQELYLHYGDAYELERKEYNYAVGEPATPWEGPRTPEPDDVMKAIVEGGRRRKEIAYKEDEEEEVSKPILKSTKRQLATQ